MNSTYKIENKLLKKRLDILTNNQFCNNVLFTKNGNYLLVFSLVFIDHINNSITSSRITKKYTLNLFNVTKKTINDLGEERTYPVALKNNSTEFHLLIDKKGTIYYKKGVVFKKLTLQSFNNFCYANNYFLEKLTVKACSKKFIGAFGHLALDYSNDFKDLVFKAITLKSKSKWILEYKHLKALINVKLLYQFNSLTEFKNFLGYNFISDNIFISLFSNLNFNPVDEYNEKFNLLFILIYIKNQSKAFKLNFIDVYLNIAAYADNHVIFSDLLLTFCHKSCIKGTIFKPGSIAVSALPLVKFNELFFNEEKKDDYEDDDELPF